MKKLLIAILAVFATAGFAQEAFPDIPAGHWAGDAVKRISDLGIVIGFPDGTYRGNESFTRYQMALVISRLLDVIQSNMDAMKAMTDADIASLRNALQELASDVAAQGVRLNAAEGAIASLGDDVSSNTARIEALENAWANMEPAGIDPAVLADLQNQIDSARVAADTAAAQAAAAAAAAGAAADAAGAASAQARQNAASIDAINDLLALLNGDIDGLKADVAALNDAMMNMPTGIDDATLAQIDRNTSDIANIREFVILLRRDQVALRDRVAALEASDADQAAAIADLQARLTKVEEDLFLVSGSIELEYLAARVSGTPFDSDRVWGINNDRSISGSNFSSGTTDLNGDDDEVDVGEVAQDLQDIEPAEGATSATLTLNVGFGTDRNGAGSPRALNSFDSVISLALTEVGTPLVDAGGDAIDLPFVFSVDDWSTTFDPIGAAPLTFQFGTDVTAQFTPYILDTETDGFKATLGTPDFLAFLDPTLTIVYGELGADTAAAADDIYFRGVRGELTPLSGDNFSATGGVSYVESTRNAGDHEDILANNGTYTAFGLDGQIGISIIDLAFEFASESDSVDAAVADSLFYITADVDVASLGLPIIKSLSANFRNMPTTWDMTDISYAEGDFAMDQSGFGVNAEFGLFILDPLSFYFDSFSIPSTGNNISALGVDAKVNLFAAFAIDAFYHMVSVDGANVDSLSSASDAPVAGPDLERDDDYDTGFGVSLVHDGASANALIPGLNLSAGYAQTGADFDTTEITVDVDTNFSFGFISLDPYAGFESITDADAGTDDTSTIKAGTGISTTPLDIFFNPSLEAAVNFRSTSHSDADVFTSTELQFAVGLTLNEFLFNNSTLTVKYGSWSGTNINNVDVAATETDGASNISDGDLNTGDTTQSTSGYEVVWDYYDLVFAYANYTDDDGTAGGTSAAQAFKISYTVTF
ncbi:MAG: S-layer homology domain-containing protein [Trueperaceae bacterium]|nr:S-layer homology domain-containing protein [Trueperaceae bacterium]